MPFVVWIIAIECGVILIKSGHIPPGYDTDLPTIKGLNDIEVYISGLRHWNALTYVDSCCRRYSLLGYKTLTRIIIMTFNFRFSIIWTRSFGMCQRNSQKKLQFFQVVNEACVNQVNSGKKDTGLTRTLSVKHIDTEILRSEMDLNQSEVVIFDDFSMLSALRREL